MNIEELTNMFTYHPPFGDQEVRYSILRDQARSLAIHIEKWCPRSREKSLAITKLQECVMMANAAIAIHEVKPDPQELDNAQIDARAPAPGAELPTLEEEPDAPPEVLNEAEDDEREQIEAEEQNL